MSTSRALSRLFAHHRSQSETSPSLRGKRAGKKKHFLIWFAKKVVTTNVGSIQNLVRREIVDNF